MKTNYLRLACLGFALVLSLGTAPAAESSVKADLEELVGRIRSRLSAGAASEKALAPELAQFDALRAKYKADKSDAAAQIVVMQALLYAQVLENDEKAIALLQELKRDFGGTAAAGKADEMISSLQQQQATNQIRRALAVGTKFPEFAEPDLSGRTVSLADFKGKVVLIDFWATWCGPCIAELPTVIAAYRKYQPAGFEIIGISLDRAEARGALTEFLKKHEMGWPQIFDGKYWQSKLAVQYGVNSIPATYLLDAEGKIAAKNLRGPELESEIARLLGKK